MGEPVLLAARDSPQDFTGATVSNIDTELRPIRFAIEGKFWDAQIYSGTLILFGRDGSLCRFDWRKFVNSLPIPPELRVVANPALLGSRKFYNREVLRVIQDPEVQPLIEDKFERLSTLCDDWNVDLPKFAHRTDNPFPFPHNDSDVHYHLLYVGSRSGVFSVSKGAIQGKQHLAAEQITDLPTLDIATKYSVVAMASGSEGLFQLASRGKKRVAEPIASNTCSTCEWSYASIVGSNRGRGLFVAAFDRVSEDAPGARTKKVRKFSKVVTDSELFLSDGSGSGSDPESSPIEWGAKDRLYRYKNGRFDVTRNSSNGTAAFESLDSVQTPVNFDMTEFVSVRVAPFGTVLEFDTHIAVLLNSGKVLKFDGEPVNWRVYPRSMNYLNHLHIIYEDRLELIAFTHDFFVPSGKRTFGTEPISADEG